ncbi:hypothetical protein CROQUDRAFT_131848 [Cronartium quercuum f. sp. fusiforme G11]|uniref:Uncharacterized protein n=1 Tax=Cronartium quercuum f. sp. fusiforme G11 TaxID=708437 RepID=A0A9P6TFC7_9BASI|nr:hypothetical protein CROQUDRAFT_131848 [Cronartium quercuum f. sp. fusiforme G11]
MVNNAFPSLNFHSFIITWTSLFYLLVPTILASFSSLGNLADAHQALQIESSSRIFTAPSQAVDGFAKSRPGLAVDTSAETSQSTLGSSKLCKRFFGRRSGCKTPPRTPLHPSQQSQEAPSVPKVKKTPSLIRFFREVLIPQKQSKKSGQSSNLDSIEDTTETQLMRPLLSDTDSQWSHEEIYEQSNLNRAGKQKAKVEYERPMRSAEGAQNPSALIDLEQLERQKQVDLAQEEEYLLWSADREMDLATRIGQYVSKENPELKNLSDKLLSISAIKYNMSVKYGGYSEEVIAYLKTRLKEEIDALDKEIEKLRKNPRSNPTSTEVPGEQEEKKLDLDWLQWGRIFAEEENDLVSHAEVHLEKVLKSKPKPESPPRLPDDEVEPRFRVDEQGFLGPKTLRDEPLPKDWATDAGSLVHWEFYLRWQEQEFFKIQNTHIRHLFDESMIATFKDIHALSKKSRDWLQGGLTTRKKISLEEFKSLENLWAFRKKTIHDLDFKNQELFSKIETFRASSDADREKNPPQLNKVLDKTLLGNFEQLSVAQRKAAIMAEQDLRNWNLNIAFLTIQGMNKVHHQLVLNALNRARQVTWGNSQFALGVLEHWDPTVKPEWPFRLPWKYSKDFSMVPPKL